jgi:hypothetical protein
VTPQKELKLEFFSYTDAADKAHALAEDLRKKGYDVEHGPTTSDPRLHVVKGWTGKMPMSDAAVLGWTNDMCSAGFAHDCEFDGWGTNPRQ